MITSYIYIYVYSLVNTLHTHIFNTFICTSVKMFHGDDDFDFEVPNEKKHLFCQLSSFETNLWLLSLYTGLCLPFVIRIIILYCEDPILNKPGFKGEAVVPGVKLWCPAIRP